MTSSDGPSATESTPLVFENGAPSQEARKGKLWLIASLLLGVVAGGVIVYLLPVGRGSKADDTSSTMRARVYDDDDFVQADDDLYKAAVHRHGSPKYIATQFISFTINTLGGLEDHGECENRTVDPSYDGKAVCYLGNSQNITEDVQHRLQIVLQVLDRIKTKDAFRADPDVDHADDVLKIFAIPEFFWRGPNGAYSIEELSSDDGVLVQLAETLQDYISDDFWNDYLFIFGTVIAARTQSDARQSGQKELQASEIEYYNYAMVYKGGPKHQHYFAVTKKYISTADFLDRSRLPNPTARQMREYADLDDELEKMLVERLDTTIIRDNVVEIDGLRIGVEICLDHRLGTLWNTLRSKHHGELVDVLVVTSAGMAIERGPNPIVHGGVVYLSDGEASSAACMRTDKNSEFDPNVVCRGNIGGLKHVPVGGPGYTSFFGLTACWDVEDISLLKGYFSTYQTQGCAFTLKTYDIDVMDEFKYYPPSVEIYPTVALPKGTY